MRIAISLPMSKRSTSDNIYFLSRRVSKLWKESVAENHPKLAATLADPAEYDNLFPGLKESETTEKYLTQERKRRLPARAFPTLTVSAQCRTHAYLLYTIPYWT